LVGLFDRQITGFGAAQHFSDHSGALAENIDRARTITEQTTFFIAIFETVSPSRSLPVVGAMLRMSLVMGPPRISLVIGQCTSLVV
jgi:hypothetical protein